MAKSEALHLTTAAFWHNNILWACGVNWSVLTISDSNSNPNPCHRAITAPSLGVFVIYLPLNCLRNIRVTKTQ